MAIDQNGAGSQSNACAFLQKVPNGSSVNESKFINFRMLDFRMFRHVKLKHCFEPYHSFLEFSCSHSKVCQPCTRIYLLLWWFCERNSDSIAQSILVKSISSTYTWVCSGTKVLDDNFHFFIRNRFSCIPEVGFQYQLQISSYHPHLLQLR